MDYISWKRDIDADLETLAILIDMVKDITPEYDYKLNQLLKVIQNKEANPINPGNKKVLILQHLQIQQSIYMRISHPRQKHWG